MASYVYSPPTNILAVSKRVIQGVFNRLFGQVSDFLGKQGLLGKAEAMDMAEEFVNQASEPLEQAKIVAREAKNISHLPDYMKDHLNRLI